MRVLIALVACLATGAHALQAVNTNRLREQHVAVGLGPDAANDVSGKGPSRISGYFTLDRSPSHNARMFYFYFEARSNSETAPLVLWMTGGPGCSSELAVFYENGPFKINENMTVSETKYGWDVSANMIYVDQPINTGFSYSDDPRDERHSSERGVANDMLDFLNEFLLAHPELDGRDFYVTGESYAGHYVPAVSSRIFRANRDKEAWVKAHINLKGFAIGNGLTDPGIQYGAYADYAFENGLISEDARDVILAAYPACKTAIDVCNAHDWEAACILAVQYCSATQMQGTLMAIGTNINIYDIRKECEGQLCYDFSLMERYLALPATRKALGVEKEWEACNMTVYQDMQADWMRDYEPLFPPMLEAGIRALVYAGNQDFICNWVGNSRWVANVTWEGRTAQAPSPMPWKVQGKDAGMLTDYGPLQFLNVYDAGHMVPMDQPVAALDMITKFINNEPLVPTAPSQQQQQIEVASEA